MYQQNVVKVNMLKKHYVLIKDSSEFLYDYTLRHGRKHFCLYCLQAFRTAEKLKYHNKDFFRINGKQTIKIPKRRKYVKFKNPGRKIKPPFTIYVGFESLLVTAGNGKQNPNESYTNKYQTHVAYSYGYKFVCLDDTFSKPFKSYLGENEESKYCSDVMKKHTCDD